MAYECGVEEYAMLGVKQGYSVEELDSFLQEHSCNPADSAFYVLDIWRNKIGLQTRYLLRQIFYQAKLNRIADRFLTLGYRYVCFKYYLFSLTIFKKLFRQRSLLSLSPKKKGC